MKHFAISDDNNKDSVEIYRKGATSIVYASKKDIKKVATLPETRGSGVYVLLSSDKSELYVGETGNVLKRIDNHLRDVQKDWFEYLIFFSRSHPLDKTELEYIEAVFIKSFSTLGYKMKNGNVGKTSDVDSYNIHPIQRHEANNFIEEVKYLISRVADGSVNVFSDQKSYKQNSLTKKSIELPDTSSSMTSLASEIKSKVPFDGLTENKSTVSAVKGTTKGKPVLLKITDDLGNNVSETSGRKTYTEYIKQLSTLPEYEERLRKVAASGERTLLSLTDQSPAGKTFYTKISTDLYLHTNLSKGSIFRRVGLIADRLGIKVSVTEANEP